MLQSATKLVTARGTLADYLGKQSHGQYPSFINGMHNPFKSIQPSKEASTELSSALSDANNWFREQKEEAFQKVINLKRQEVAFLSKLCTPTEQTAVVVETLNKDWADLLKGLGETVEKGKDAQGEELPQASAIPDILKGDLDIAIGLAPFWVTKIWDFTRVKNLDSIAKVKSKEDLVAKAADVDMADAPNMEQLAKDAVAKALQDIHLSKQTGQVIYQDSSSYYPVTHNSTLGKRKLAETETELRLWPNPSSTPQESRTKRSRTTTSTTEVRECTAHYEFPKKECQWCKRWALKKEESEEIVRSSKWTPSKPSSLPKQILDLPTGKAISIIQSRMPLSMINDSDFDVKLGPGVLSIPEKIDNLLCMGHRFLFPSTFSVSLPLECYHDLARRIKWIVHFSYQKKDPSFLDRFPQFRIKHKADQSAVPDTTPIWTLAMLEKGRLEMLRQIEAIPSTTANAPVVPNYKRELAMLKNWRKQSKYLVLQSDKNLGTTVVDSEWYSRKLDDLVLNNKDFTPISEDIYLGMMGQAYNEIVATDNVWLPQEIKDYILADLTPDKARINVPKFHGLPKVHKEPWALRPIVPCHSYPLSNASKVLSMILKLRVRESPWILESTQDLARELETIKVPPGKKCWIASGDVTAMYPNIPRKRAHQILGEITRKVEPTTDGSDVELVTKLAAWSDNFLVFKHNNKYFHQKEGLAMGIPAAPDVANLYMSHFENTFAHNFVLYKRYIDDVFVIVDASSREEALEKLSVIQADGLHLTWSVDKVTINYLDLEITQEAGKYFSFKPYRKPLNSYERVPWSSYHPQHVKRAAFCGEISRMARLCSNHDRFYNEVAYVRDIYLKRGYPGALIAKWIRSEARNRWESRYEDAPGDQGGNSLWLKSVYNNVWSHIDLHKVWSAMVDGRDIESSPLGHIQDIKLSLKRFRNLGEINNKYNADVLRALHVEEEVEQVLTASEEFIPASNKGESSRAHIVKLGSNPQTRINFPGVGSHDNVVHHSDW